AGATARASRSGAPRAGGGAPRRSGSRSIEGRRGAGARRVGARQRSTADGRTGGGRCPQGAKGLTMYGLVLLLHSWVRWGVLAAGLFATFAAATDPTGARASRTDRAGLAFGTLVGGQMLLGLLLYLVLSPFTAEAFHDFGAAMRNSQLRFWTVEHLTTMLVAVILVHVGRVLGRKAK